MIIYDEDKIHNLTEYGIQIPVSADKSKKILEHLISHPILKKSISKWYQKRVGHKITREDLLRVHSKEYIKKLYSNDLESEIMKTYELIDTKGKLHRYDPTKATLNIQGLFDDILKKVSGSYQACVTALEKGFSFFFGGGMHHASKDSGNGFCLVNDIVIAVRKMQNEKNIRKVWIIDVDAHKGDGTALLTLGDDSVKTLSIHMSKGWPLNCKKTNDKGELNPSFIPSDIDIPISKGEESSFLNKLENGLLELSSFFIPDIAVVILGADPYEKDELESAKDLNLTLFQMMQRDLMIYDFLKKNSIPQAYLMAGGYGKHSWEVYAQFLEYVLLDLYK